MKWTYLSIALPIQFANLRSRASGTLYSPPDGTEVVLRPADDPQAVDDTKFEAESSYDEQGKSYGPKTEKGREKAYLKIN